MNACRCLNRTKETQLSTWTNEAYETAQYWPPNSCWQPALAYSPHTKELDRGVPRGGSKGGDKPSRPELHQLGSENLVGERLEVVLKGLRPVDLLHIHQGFFFRAIPHLEPAPVPWWAALIPPIGTVRLSIASRPTTAKAVSYEAGVKLVGPI